MTVFILALSIFDLDMAFSVIEAIKYNLVITTAFPQNQGLTRTHSEICCQFKNTK